MIHIFNSMPYLDPCLLTHLKCNQGSALLFSQLIILLSFKENWKLTSQLHSKNIKHLTLQCDYKLSAFNSLPCTRKFIFLIYYVSSYSKRYTALYSGGVLDKGTYIWAIKEAPIISWETHLLWSVFHCCLFFCFHVCLHNLVEHFPSQLGEEEKILHWPPRDGVCRKKGGMGGKLKWFQSLLLSFWL